MKKAYIVIIIAGLALIAILIWPKNSSRIENPSTSNPDSAEQTASIKGCYVAMNGQDIYTLTILTQKDARVTGLLSFKNFQKDSSSGTFAGSYSQGILAGEYSFNSEGMQSVMQVAFKREGDSFIRGYGPMSVDGTQFEDPRAIIYDSNSVLSVFKPGACE